MLMVSLHMTFPFSRLKGERDIQRFGEYCGAAAGGGGADRIEHGRCPRESARGLGPGVLLRIFQYRRLKTVRTHLARI